MIVYSIKDIEEITGIKAHTLRIWEKRYDIIVPERTKTNIRYYTDDHLKQILNICFLNKNGIKISHIAMMTSREILQKVAILTNTEKDIDQLLDSLTLAVINLDEKSVTRILDNYVTQIGFEKTMDILINPFIEKLSALWISGSIQSVHESFISEILKHKTITEIRALECFYACDKTHILLFLSEGEKQELSILYFKYLLKSIGIKTTLVGFDLSLKDVLEAYNIIRPTHIYSIFNEESTEYDLSTAVKYICKTIYPCQFLASGYMAISLKENPPENCKVVTELSEAISYFKPLVGVIA